MTDRDMEEARMLYPSQIFEAVGGISDPVGGARRTKAVLKQCICLSGKFVKLNAFTNERQYALVESKWSSTVDTIFEKWCEAAVSADPNLARVLSDDSSTEHIRPCVKKCPPSGSTGSNDEWPVTAVIAEQKPEMQQSVLPLGPGVPMTDVIAEQAPMYEKASIDEHYLDITGMDRFFGCMQWTSELRQRIIKETGLPISCGLSVNKTVSKIATGEAKPNGEIEIPDGGVMPFLSPLSPPSTGERGSHLSNIVHRGGRDEGTGVLVLHARLHVSNAPFVRIVDVWGPTQGRKRL